MFMKLMRGFTMTGCMLGMGALIIGILYNDGAWSLPGTAVFVVFAALRFGVLATDEEKREMDEPKKKPGGEPGK